MTPMGRKCSLIPGRVGIPVVHVAVAVSTHSKLTRALDVVEDLANITKESSSLGVQVAPFEDIAKGINMGTYPHKFIKFDYMVSALVSQTKCGIISTQVLFGTGTRTNTDPNGTEANSAVAVLLAILVHGHELQCWGSAIFIILALLKGIIKHAFNYKADSLEAKAVFKRNLTRQWRHLTWPAFGSQ